MPKYEQFGLNAISTLDGAINASVTSLDVLSATGFPTDGNFRITIDDELLLVTAVSGTTFTVVRGIESTTAASHLDGADVIQTLTADSITQLAKDNIPFARDTDRPALNTIVDSSGNILDSTDFTWLNQGSATITDLSSGGMALVVPAAASNNIRGLHKSAPGTPYILTVGFAPQLHADSTCIAGIGFRESATGKLIVIGSAKVDELAIYKFNSPTSFNTSLFARVEWPMARLIQWFQIEDDGTDLFFRTGVDGINFQDIADEGRGTFFTTAPDQILFYCNSNNATYGVTSAIIAWEES